MTKMLSFPQAIGLGYILNMDGIITIEQKLPPSFFISHNCLGSTNKSVLAKDVLTGNRLALYKIPLGVVPCI